jgi:hypothetical protein
MDQATNRSLMQSLEPFVGDWSVSAGFAPGVDAHTAFEWTLDGQFLVQRSQIPVEGAPDSLSVIGVDPAGEAFIQHYFDSRGIARLYAMTFADGLWTLHRDEPDFSPLPFHQRYTGSFTDDGDAIRGRWETSDDGRDWKLDFELNYTRLG